MHGISGYRAAPLAEEHAPDVPSGVIYSYMPLPLRSGLPVHINGSFAITSNRKYMVAQNEDDKFDVRPVWNRLLLQDAVCGAYLHALADLRTLLPSTLLSPHPSPLLLSTEAEAPPLADAAFHSLWPNPHHVMPTVESLIRGFYRELTVGINTPPLFSDGSHWACFCDTLFLDFCYVASPIGPTAVEVFRRCVATGDVKREEGERVGRDGCDGHGDKGSVDREIVVRLPAWMEQAWQIADVAQHIHNRCDVVRFFREFFLPKLECVTAVHRDALLLDALRRNDDKLNQVSLPHRRYKFLLALFCSFYIFFTDSLPTLIYAS